LVIELLSENELFAMAGHELTHLAADHLKRGRVTRLLSGLATSEALWNLGANIISFKLSGAVVAGLAFCAVILTNTFVNFSEYAQQERQANRGSVLLTQKPKELVSAFEKLVKAKVEEINKRPNTILNKANKFFIELFYRTHPAHILRVASKHNIPA
jgi:Zn-dependent protease with chaperone function